MYINCKKSTKKQQAYDFYNAYRWEKVTRPTFYYRVRLWWTETWEEKIKLKIHNQNRKLNYVPKGKRAKEITWYETQPEPKASKTLFRNRLNLNYPKEQAILMWDAWLSVRRGRNIYHPGQVKTYVPQKKEIKKENPSDFMIEVTYPSEIARIFRQEYENMIEKIEEDLIYTSEKTEIVELNKRLEQLQKELVCFNLYNPK